MVRIVDKYNITREPISLTIGIVGITIAIFYMLTKFGIFQPSVYLSDVTFAYFFASYTLIAGIVITFKSLKK